MCVPAGSISSAALALLMALAFAGCHDDDFAPHRGAGAVGLYDDLFSVSAAGASHVVAVGYRGAAYWSEDGGESWHEGASATERLLYAVSMADRRRGWAVGQRGTVLRTEDGGRSWLPPDASRFPPSLGFLRDLRFASGDVRLGFIVGREGTILRSRDGGDSWAQVFPLPEFRSSSPVSPRR